MKKRAKESSQRIKRWEEIIEKDKSFYVLEVDGKVVGFTSFGKSHNSKYSDYGEIYSIYFDEKYQGKGYGKKLFNFSISKLKENYDDIIILCFMENEAINFYKRMGCKVLEIYKEKLYDSEVDQCLLYYNSK